MSDVISLLSDLIKINSENPPGNETGMVDFLFPLLKDKGFSVEIVEPIKKRQNIIAVLDSKKKGKSILFNGHMDTKPAYPKNGMDRNWNFDPFTPVIKEDRLYGLGSSDMKGGIAVAVTSAIDFSEKFKDKFSGKLILLLVSDEEMNSTQGMKYLIKNKKIKADMAINFEPTEIKICAQQLGNIWLEIEIFGKMGHASEPWKSNSAIMIALDMITEIKRFTEELKAKKNNDEFPNHPSLNIGNINGGYHPGTVPGYCKFSLDIRILPNDTSKEYITLLKERLKNFKKGYSKKFKYTLSNFGSGGLESGYTSKESDVVKYIKKAYKSVTNKNAKLGYMKGGTDANFLINNYNIPTIVFGPGSLKQAHSVNEYNSISQVKVCKKITDNFLEITLVK